LLTDSFLKEIEVESGGSVTFKQSGVYELDVPSTVQYKVKNDLTQYYTKPSSGIPETDLSADVQTKLNSGGSEREWVLKGTLTTGIQWVTVDFSECEEVYITGIVKTAENTFVILSAKPMYAGIINLNTSSTKVSFFKYHIKDVFGEMATDYARVSTDEAPSSFYTIATTYDYRRSLKTITQIGFEQTYFNRTESYDIKIYAR